MFRNLVSCSLKNNARQAAAWSGLDTLVRQGFGFLITVILARLLTPDDFGTVALLAIFIGIAGVFVNVGLGQALIQRQDVTHIDESSVFWFNLAAAFAVMLVLIMGSPIIADFFKLPVLVPITVALAVNVVIGALGSVQATLMSKRLDFKTQMKIGAISTLVSGGVAIYLAWVGFGLWTLVVQVLVGSFLSTSLLWVLSPWRPLQQFSKESFAKLFGFGGWLFASALLDTIFQRGYTLLIGKYYTPYDLGIFNRADSTQQLTVSVVSGVLERVSFPILSAVKHDRALLQRGVCIAIRSMMLITTPVMLGLLAVAEPFVLGVFGEQWRPAVSILQVLCLAGVLWPVHIVNLSALQAQGHSKLFFRLEIIKKSIGIGLLIAGSYFGLIGIAWSRVLQSAIAMLINSYYTKKFLDYGILAQLKDIFPILLMSAVMAIVVAILPYWFWFGDMLLLVVSIVIGMVLYVLMNISLDGEAFRESVALIRGKP